MSRKKCKAKRQAGVEMYNTYEDESKLRIRIGVKPCCYIYRYMYMCIYIGWDSVGRNKMIKSRREV